MGLPLAGHIEVTSCSVLPHILSYIVEIQKLTEYKVVWLLARWQLQRRRQAPKTAAGAAWQHSTKVHFIQIYLLYILDVCW